MITRLPGRGTIALATAFILASVALTLFVWQSVGGNIPLQPKRYQLLAQFDNASQLTKNADVRISGVSVGKVVDIVPRGVRTEATLAIEARFAPLPSDVRAILRQKTLLGETFVEISPGSESAPKLPEGGSIPREQIADTQPLDRILGTFDEPTRKAVKEMLTDGGALLEGRGADLNAGLGHLALGARQLERVVGVLDGQRAALRGLVRDTGTVFRTVGAEDAAIGELIDAGHAALSATAQRDTELTATIERTPALLAELRATTVAAERTARLAAPLLADFRPVAPLVAPALEVTRDVAPQLRRLLTDIEGLLPTARAALPAAAKIVEGMSPLMDVLEPAASEVTPVIDYMSLYRRELVATMGNVTASSNGMSKATDGTLTPYLRTLIPFGAETPVGYSSRLGSNRHAAYRAPGGLAPLASGLDSAGCGHASEGGNAPPCRVQEGWSFKGGPARYFQRIEPAQAGSAVAALRAIVAAFSS